MNADRRNMWCDSEYFTHYQGIYGEIAPVTLEDESVIAEFDEELIESIYSDLHDTSIRQPSHPYNGDVTPVA
jgi:hypothetical protein